MFATNVDERRGMNAQTVNVAVVDDDGSVRRAVARLLGAAGFNPVGYSSAEEFLADSTRARTDCLVLDLHLGGMSGLDLQERLADGAAPPIIFVTAHQEPDAEEQARRTGCVAFFHKPVSGRALLEAVRRAVASSGRPAEPAS
jgi:FixJ family two-component response regulator